MPMRRGRLAARRKAVGLSQEQLAERLGVDRSTIGRWEGGRTDPQPWMRPRLARLLGISADQLDGMLTVGAAGDDVERLERALAHPNGTDLVTVAHLRQRVQELDEQYVRVPSTLLLADTGQCLSQAGYLAAHVGNWTVRRELSQVQAEAAILMGQLVWDASQRRDHVSAYSYLDEAARMARDRGHRALEALALLRKSMISLYGQVNPREGEAIALHAAETAKSVSTVLKGLAVLHAAEAYAMQGCAGPCWKALQTADRYFGRVTSKDVAVALYSPGLLGRMAGSCYLTLGDPRRAQVLLEETAGACGEQSKALAIVLGNLALADIQLGDLDAAAERLHQAIDVVQLNWGGGGLNIIFRVGRALLPWRTAPVVREVHERLLGLIAADQGG